MDFCKGMPVSFLENYGSSEGYFSYTDTPGGEDMKLIGDNGIFYEWLPYSPGEIHANKPIRTADVVAGEKYVLCVSTNAGLWRYVMNDVVEFTNVTPPRIRVAGRVSDMIDRFGEALHFSEAKNTIDTIFRKWNIPYERLIIGHRLNPITGIPVHHWFIISDFAKEDTGAVHTEIDEELCRINRHFAIRRETGALEAPRLAFIRPDRFHEWFFNKLKSRAQTKLPNFLSDDQKIEELLAYSDSKGS